MTKFLYLTKRDLLLYFRDRGAVFFSLLSMLIIIALMLFFLGDMHINGIVEMLSALPAHDTADDKKNAEIFMLTWTFAGIIPINAAMVALSTLSSIIKDKETGKSRAIHTAPISHFTITISYITAACIASMLICMITLALSEGYLCNKGMEIFSFAEHIRLFGMILVNSFTYSAIMYLCAMFVKSGGAWSGLGTVIGTLVGFLGGIYLPIGNLSEGLQNVLGCTPVIYGTVMFRNVMTDSIIDMTFADAPVEMIDKTESIMGIDYRVFGNSVSVAECIMVVLAFGLVVTMIGAAVTVFKNQKDR